MIIITLIINPIVHSDHNLIAIRACPSFTHLTTTRHSPVGSYNPQVYLYLNLTNRDKSIAWQSRFRQQSETETVKLPRVRFFKKRNPATIDLYIRTWHQQNTHRDGRGTLTLVTTGDQIVCKFFHYGGCLLRLDRIFVDRNYDS